MRTSLLSLGCLTLLGCGSQMTNSDAGSHHDPVTELRFSAKVGTADFACGTTYTLGSPASQYHPKDLRFYISEIALVTEEGEKVPFALTADGTYQSTTVAMLDFENAAGDCSNGTATTHTVVTGLAPGDHYSAVEFTLGVPFAENHQDASAAAAPLNSTALFWNWQGGYKFLRADGNTTGLPMGHNVHVGSTGCMPGSTPNSVSSCTSPNRARISLDTYSAATSVIVFDLAKLLSGSNLDTNMAMTAPGCMSGATDADCGDIFAKLGLAFGTASAGTQSVFSITN